MLKFILISSIILCSSFQSIACSCIEEYIDNFCESTDENNIIALVTIYEDIDYNLKRIKVLEELNLSLEFDEGILEGQDGLNCGEELGLFDIGDTLIVAVFDKGDSLYYLDGCHLYYLRYEKGIVKGNITPEIQQTSYAHFKQDVVTCSLISNQNEFENISLDIYPNPSSSKLYVRSDSDLLDIEILSITGKSVYHLSNNNRPEISIDINHLDTGKYYARIRTREAVIFRRIIKL